jgi:integrative and conjugative element protein (TIGR02256 family)
MVTEAARHGPLETGGVLLGWRNGDDVVVSRVVGPGPGAQHESSTFHPDSEWQAARIADLYEQAGRRMEYLGDWHTHPGGRPRPSRRDERTLRHIARTAEARCPDPVMVILGSAAAGDASVWKAGAFVLQDGSRWRPRRIRTTEARQLLMPNSTDVWNG